MSDLNSYMEQLKRQQRESQDAQVNQMLGSVGLDSTGAAIPDWKPAEKAAPPPPVTSNPFIRSVEDLYLGYRESAAGAYNLAANAFGLIDKAAEKLSNWTGLPKGGAAAGMIEPFLRQAAQSVKPTEADFAGRDQFADYLYRAIGAVPATVATYIAGGHVTGSGIAGMALIDAVRESDKGAWEAIKAGLQGALMGTALKVIEPFSRPVRAAAGALGFGGIAALQPGATPAEVVAQAAVGGTMAALAPTKTQETKPGLGEQIPPVEPTAPVAETQQGLPAPEARLALPPPADFVGAKPPAEGAIRQPGAEPLKALESPEMIAARAELQTAQANADTYVRQRGLGQILDDVVKNTTSEPVRRAVDLVRQRVDEEARFGTVVEQLKNPETRTALGLPSPASLSADAMLNAEIKNAEFRQTERGAKLLKAQLGLNEELSRLQNEETTAKIETTAQELGVTPQAVIHSAKVVEAVKQVEPEFAKIVEAEAGKGRRETTGGTPYEIVNLPIEGLKLSKEVPNFKKGADKTTGLVKGQQLQGEFDRQGLGPIIVWERTNGSLEVITGRHRLDLARRQGEKTIPAQVVREVDGFDARQARIIDAEQNIKDEKGTVEDYARYFREANITAEAAKNRGLLSRASQLDSWVLGKDAASETFDSFTAGNVTFDQAVAIARAAPKDADLQRVGLLYALKNPKAERSEIANFVKVIADSGKPPPQAYDQMTMFGDDAAVKQAMAMSKKAAGILAELKRERADLGLAKKPQARIDRAKAQGININDPVVVLKRITQLDGEIDAWETWAARPELVAQLRGTPSAPMFEQTSAGAQGVIPGAEGRTIPGSALKAKVGQTEAPTALERTATGETQLDLGGRVSETPGTAPSIEPSGQSATTSTAYRSVEDARVLETAKRYGVSYLSNYELLTLFAADPTAKPEILQVLRARVEQPYSEGGGRTPLADRIFHALGESGFSTFDINFALARTLSGAIYGFSQGDTMEERLKNALFYGGLAALANPKMIKTIIQTARRIDPAGIKKIETRDQGMTATVNQSFDPKQADPKGMAEFLRMTNEGIDTQGRVQGINYDHINTPMDVKYTIGKMAKVYQAELDKARKIDPATGKGVSHEETIAAAENLKGTKAGAPERILEWPDGQPMTDPELLLARMIRNDLGAGLKENTARFLNDLSQQNLVAFIDNFNRYRMVQSVYGGQATGRGRGLEALKIDVGNSGEAEFHRMLGNVVESIDPTGWTPERLAAAIAQVPDLESLNRAVDIAARPGMHDMLLEAFYGVSMLSNPKTWTVNMAGSPMAFAWQVAKRTIAGGLTAVSGRSGDPAYVQPVEPLMMLQAIKDSYHDAFTVAQKAFVTGERQYPHGQGGKQSFARPNAITYENLKGVYPKAFGAAESALENLGIDAQKLKYGIDLLGSVARLSTRLMLAPDEFNELIGTRMELYARTARSVAAEGLPLSDQIALARQRIINMSEFSSADREAGKQFALYNTFNQEPGAITMRIVGAIESLNKSPDIDPIWYLATKAVVPFVTIPANLGRWAARESGPTAFLSRNIKEQMAKGGADAQVAWAGVALGSMVLTAAANMAMNGYLNGAAPVSKSDRLVWEADGNIEYGIKTPVGSFGINRLDPIAIPFAWAADFVNLAGHLDAYDQLTLVATAILTMTHDLASKNYVQGVTNFMHAITSGDSKEIQSFVKGEVGSLLVPGIVRGIRQETDPYRRATNEAFDAARAQTPWGSTDYPPVLDRFARPIYSGYGASQGWASLFGILNPIQYRAPNESKVIQEITGNKIPIPGLSDTIYGAKDNPYDNKPADSRTGVKLEGWEFYLYNKYSGEKLFEQLSRTVETPQWKSATPGPDGGKAIMLNVLVAASDEYARQKLLGESPDLSAAVREKQQHRQEALRPGPGLQVPMTQ